MVFMIFPGKRKPCSDVYTTVFTVYLDGGVDDERVKDGEEQEWEESVEGHGDVGRDHVFRHAPPINNRRCP